jgi:hypothetical protein
MDVLLAVMGTLAGGRRKKAGRNPKIWEIGASIVGILAVIVK